MAISRQFDGKKFLLTNQNGQRRFGDWDSTCESSG